MGKPHQLSHVHARVRLQAKAEFLAAVDGHEEGKRDRINAVDEEHRLAPARHGNERFPMHAGGASKLKEVSPGNRRNGGQTDHTSKSDREARGCCAARFCARVTTLPGRPRRAASSWTSAMPR